MNKLHGADGLRTRLLRSNSMVSRLCRTYSANRAEAANSERFREISRLWWDLLASRQDWLAAGELGEVSTAICPTESFGWENWAWALHKQGKTKEAYKVLAPILRQLKLPGPPSGRAAYCLACFCAVLGKNGEAKRWLRLASLRAVNKEAFRLHVLREPDLRDIWATLDSSN